MFAVYSYIAPIVTEVGGLPDTAVPVFLLFLGLGMVAGTWAAGPLADWSILRSLLASSIGIGAVLLAFAGLAPFGWVAILPAFFITFVGSVLVVNLQLRLMDVAGEAQTLGAAMNHASLNLANALGAWLGGVVIAAGYGYGSTALVGAALSVAGFLVVVASVLVHVRTAPPAVVER
jgi:MFS transporter, DHA1 family, inner membrane transport protein